MTAEPRFNPARRKARRRALDVLYEADLRGLPPRDVLAARQQISLRQPEAPKFAGYATEIVEGVVAHRARIDELLASYAEGWTLERMPPVDRNLLRIAVYELLWQDDVDDPVAISEAVELAKELSTDESPGFINGVLDRIAEYAAR